MSLTRFVCRVYILSVCTLPTQTSANNLVLILLGFPKKNDRNAAACSLKWRMCVSVSSSIPSECRHPHLAARRCTHLANQFVCSAGRTIGCIVKTSFPDSFCRFTSYSAKTYYVSQMPNHGL